MLTHVHTSLRLLLQGPRVYLQRRLKDATIMFNKACFHCILWGIKSPSNVLLFCSVLYHHTHEVCTLVTVNDLWRPISCH